MHHRTSWVRASLALVALVLVAIGCASDTETTGGSDGTTPTTLEEVTFVVGWLPAEITGGLYAAQQQGYYEDAGLDVNIVANFSSSPTTAVPTGKAQFGYADSDEILEMRAKGIAALGLYAAYQSTPRNFTYHNQDPLAGFEDLTGRTVYVDLGDAWWEYVKSVYGLTDITEIRYNVRAFASDPSSVIQGFNGGELGIVAEFGLDLGTLSLAEAGWNPYQYVIFGMESFVEENPEIVRSFIGATTDGYEYYKDNYESVNEYMVQFDSEFDAVTMNASYELQEETIFGGDAATIGLGYMTAERWQATQDALLQVGVLEEPIEVTEAFTTDYLPQS